MTPHEVLVKARNMIDRGGWWDGHYGCSPTATCALNAIGDAGEDEHSIYGPAARVFRQVTGSSSIPEWNDAPERTKEEVLAAFDKAITATAPSPDFASLETPQLVSA